MARPRMILEPVDTVLTRDHRALVEPYLVELRGTAADQLIASARSVESPLPTITAGGGHIGVCDPYLVQVAHGSDPKGDESRARSIDATLPSVCGNRGEWAVVEPSLLPRTKVDLYDQSASQPTRARPPSSNSSVASVAMATSRCSIRGTITRNIASMSGSICNV